MNSKKNLSHYWLPVAIAAVYLFLYIPIIVLILFSFNASDTAYAWTGLSLRWYKELFLSTEIWYSTINSLIVAFSSVVLSVIMGTLLVYGSQKYIERIMELFYGSVLFPEIIIAV